MKKFTLFFVAFISAMNVLADDVSFKALQYETLPDMNIMRRGHSIFTTSSGDIVVVGGHTDGFSLTATAERLHDGQWEMIQIDNAHDGGAAIPLTDGRVLICGGMGSGYGIGQDNVCDIYDPATNTFTSAAGMNTSRGFCNGVLTGDDNNVLISGNWYATDRTFELWNGSKWKAFGSKDRQLNVPFLFSAGEGIVYVLGSASNYGYQEDVVVWKVDTRQLMYEKVENHGLEDYRIIHGDYFCPIPNAGRNLFLAKKNSTNPDNTINLMSFDASTGQASSVVELPLVFPENGVEISWMSVVLYSEARQEAYVIGGFKKTLVVANYNFQKGSLTVYSGGPFDGTLNYGAWIIEPSTGNIIFTGGSKDEDNYTMIPR